MKEAISYGLLAVMTSAIAVAIIWRRRYLNEVTVAGRGQLRAKLPRFAQWLVPRYLYSPRYVSVEAVFGEILALVLAATMWLAFIGALRDALGRR